VHHRGRHYTVEGIQFLPRPAQQPGVPVWAAGSPGNVKPLRRAARRSGQVGCAAAASPAMYRTLGGVELLPPPERRPGGSFGVGGLSRVLSGGGRSPTDPVDID
jgi:alkanesulfonate monooxygenase SsuD/methylene tetrahydromethanopterin reductase-like flavin-dependent oxidoreductase (luciferase family)